MFERAIIRREMNWWTVKLTVGKVSWSAKAKSLPVLKERLRSRVPRGVNYRVEVASNETALLRAPIVKEMVKNAEAALAAAKKEQGEVIKELRASGISVREIGEFVGLSHQRVQQILRAKR